MGRLKRRKSTRRSKANRGPHQVQITVSVDPYVLRTFGQLWASLEGARLLTDRAATLFQESWDQGDDLTVEQRGETAVAIGVAKVYSDDCGTGRCKPQSLK